jgi:hypothetical protein
VGDEQWNPVSGLLAVRSIQPDLNGSAIDVNIPDHFQRMTIDAHGTDV